ncbi:isochorismatase family protein [Paraburkholderia acidicola]|uniref:Isochorismatase family protein n=1 Tax=Paraburkholderia acidicola TaxID=1912599 RepID=A0ABV1LX85_9BURK
MSNNVERFGALTPENCAVLLVDHNLGFIQVCHGDRTDIKNGVVALARTARVYNLPIVISKTPDDSISGPLIPQLLEVVKDCQMVNRKLADMDSLNDSEVSAALKATGRKKIVIAGIMTDVCVLMTTLHALKDGYEVYVVENASGGSDPVSVRNALTRMQQAGATVVSWLTLLSELQSNWNYADPEKARTAGGLVKIISDHANGWSNLNDFYYGIKSSSS